MSYTINPNAKNRWARNAENTMDLSLETDASSVYLDNGRTLEQEIGEGSMVSNVTTVDSGMEKVIDDTYDGAYESCKMYGKSLVNLINYNDSNINTSGKYVQFNSMVWDVVGKTVTVFNYGSKTVRTQMSKNGTYYRQLDFEPNTKTLVKLESDEKLERIRGLSAENWTLDEVGLNELKTTTMILEGDYTKQDVSYFTGLCDVKAPILKNVGKNLFDSSDSTMKSSWWILTEGGSTNVKKEELPTNYSVIIPATSDSQYTVSGGNITRNFYAFLDEQYNVLHANEMIQKTTKSLSPKGTAYALFYLNHENIENVTNLQIEEGSISTLYEDYKTNILETSNDLVLRGLPNGIKDSYDCLTGEYVRRVGEIVLNGSEDWANQNGENLVKDNTLIFSHGIGEMKDLTQQENDSDRELLCDKQKVMSSDSLWNTDKEGISKGVKTRDIRLRILKSKLSTEDINGLKLYLQANPITIQYELAEPIVTQIEPPTTPFAYENGHIILESGHEGQSLLPMLEYSTVVNKTGLIENVAKTIQRQEKQITKLEQMLIQNIINLDYNNTLLTLKNEMEEML